VNDFPRLIERRDLADAARSSQVSRRDLLAATVVLGLTAAGAGIAARVVGATPQPPPAQPSAPLTMHAGHGGQGTAPLATPRLGEQADGTRLWRVKVGGFSAEDGIDAQAFFPAEITINAGDGILFDFGPGGFHTVTFLSGQEPPPVLIPDDAAGTPAAEPPRMLLNPDVAFAVGGTTYDGAGYLNSGIDILREAGDPFVLTFSEPGDYTYVCLPHATVMAARVIVQEAGAPLPYEQADYDAMADEQLTAIIESGREDLATNQEATATERAGGTTLWEVSAGVGADQARVMRFLPANLEVKAGDTVRWVNRSPGEGHTVSFLSGEEKPEEFIVEPRESGPPKLVFNPAELYPAGGSEYDGAGFVSSGFFGEPFGPQTYELTFTAPGTFEYVCLPHVPMAMVGTIAVSER
jgi:plastocyanin